MGPKPRTSLNNTFVTAAKDGLRIEGAGLAGGAVRNNLWVDTGNVDTGSFDADHNGYFNAPTDIASSSDVNGDPLLDAQYRLMSGSPMIDVGVDVGLGFVGSAPDLGFSESGDLDPCAAATAGTGGASGAGVGGAPSGGGGASVGDTSGTGGKGAGASANDSSGDDAGCGCRAPATPRSGPDGLVALALLTWTACRRRFAIRRSGKHCPNEAQPAGARASSRASTPSSSRERKS